MYYYPANSSYIEDTPLRDTTLGFQVNGNIDISPNLPDRSKVNFGINGMPFPNTDEKSYYCVNRTALNATIVEPPIIQNAFVSAAQSRIYIGNDNESNPEFGGLIFENTSQYSPAQLPTKALLK